MSPPDAAAPIVLDSSISSIERVQSVLSELWRLHPWVGELDRMAAQTAIIELATNIVRYALNAPGAIAEVRVTITPTALLVHTLDHGPIFDGDIRARAMPDLTAESGRGLGVIAALTHEFDYTRDEAGNHWSLVRRLTPSGPEQ